MRRSLFILALLTASSLNAATGIKDLTISGTLNGTPTGGTLDLSAVTVSGIPADAHTHPESDITGLAADLAAKETPAGAQTKANAAQAAAVQRGNHTGTQALSTISDAGTAAGLAADTSTALGTSDIKLPTQNAVKVYVDSVAAGLSIRNSVFGATVAALPANSYNNGTAGVGATLTESGNGALSIDGQTPSVGNRILVKNEVAGANNGVYVVTVVGSGAAPYVLTRATDTDQAAEVPGAFVFVQGGATLGATGWVVSGVGPYTMGTTSITFTQFNSSGGAVASVAGKTGAVTLVIADITNAGTSAALNVPASGNAASGEVVKGNDTRLTDARTPSDATVTTTKIAAATLVIASETITSNNNDTTLPTSAAVKAYVDGETATLTNKRITKRVATLTDSATVTPATDSYDAGILTTLSQPTTIANPTGTPTAMQTYVLRIKSTTARAFTWGSMYRGSVDLALPSTSTGSGLWDYFGFVWNDTDSKWDLIASNTGF